MRPLITGSSGFLAGHLAAALRRRYHEVIGIDIKAPVPGRCAYAIQGDITNIDVAERAIAEYECDTMFHLAAMPQVSTAVAYPAGTLDSNVRGTWNVLEACRRQKVRRVIVASSDKVYSNGPVPYRETQSLWPHGIYATSKAMGDFVAQSYARDFHMPIAIVRCGNLYGPCHVNWSTLIPGTIRGVLRGERPILRSDGSPRRDFLYVEDAVAGYVALADSDKVGAWNFGATAVVPPTALMVVQEILSLMGSHLQPDIRGTATDEIQEQWLDWTKANAQLRWEPRHTLKTGLEETIAWHRKQV